MLRSSCRCVCSVPRFSLGSTGRDWARRSCSWVPAGRTICPAGFLAILDAYFSDHMQKMPDDYKLMPRSSQRTNSWAFMPSRWPEMPGWTSSLSLSAPPRSDTASRTPRAPVPAELGGNRGGLCTSAADKSLSRTPSCGLGPESLVPKRARCEHYDRKDHRPCRAKALMR